MLFCFFDFICFSGPENDVAVSGSVFYDPINRSLALPFRTEKSFPSNPLLDCTFYTCCWSAVHFLAAERSKTRIRFAIGGGARRVYKTSYNKEYN